MALLPPFFLDCVVAIGTKDEKGVASWLASGFLYGRLMENIVETGMKRYYIFLVTNRHVVEGKQAIVLRFNPTEALPAREFDLDLFRSGAAIWTAHPDATVDVAVVPINADYLVAQGIKFSYFRSDDHCLTREAASEAGLSEGDGVFVLGFPMGQVGGDRNYPLVRQGAIARVRDWMAGASREIVVDVTVFPGNSGGPVVTRPEVTSIVGTTAPQRANLIGVVASYVPYRDIAVSAQTKLPRVIFEENSGLASVVPVDYLSEAVEASLVALKRVPTAEAVDVPPEKDAVPQAAVPRRRPSRKPRKASDPGKLDG